MMCSSAGLVATSLLLQAVLHLLLCLSLLMVRTTLSPRGAHHHSQFVRLHLVPSPDRHPRTITLSISMAITCPAVSSTSAARPPRPAYRQPSFFAEIADFFFARNESLWTRITLTTRLIRRSGADVAGLPVTERSQNLLHYGTNVVVAWRLAFLATSS
jgi:hypothetical protein